MVELIQGDYKNVKAYYGKKKTSEYFEFDFVYAGPLEVFREIDRFIWESVHQKTRYKNRYDGPVLIEVTSWNKKDINEYFDAFMYYIKDKYEGKCTFFCKEPCSEELEGKLREFFDIKIVNAGFEAAVSDVKTIGFSIDGGKEKVDVRG